MRHTEVFTSVKKSSRKHSPNQILVFSVCAVPVRTAWPGRQNYVSEQRTSISKLTQMQFICAPVSSQGMPKGEAVSAVTFPAILRKESSKD